MKILFSIFPRTFNDISNKGAAFTFPFSRWLALIPDLWKLNNVLESSHAIAFLLSVHMQYACKSVHFIYHEISLRRLLMQSKRRPIKPHKFLRDNKAALHFYIEQKLKQISIAQSRGKFNNFRTLVFSIFVARKYRNRDIKPQLLRSNLNQLSYRLTCDLIGSVFTWHMYEPLSFNWTCEMCNFHVWEKILIELNHTKYACDYLHCVHCE